MLIVNFLVKVKYDYKCNYSFVKINKILLDIETLVIYSSLDLIFGSKSIIFVGSNLS